MTGLATATATASLSMYPFPSLRGAWDRLYDAVRTAVPDASPELQWDLDPHDSWLDPHLALGMSCGWPLVTALREQVRTIGAFAYEFDDDVSHLYRTVIISGPRAERSRTAAVNRHDSLSGHISLLASMDTDATSWPGPVVWTGAHLDSIAAVRDGRADIASIDAMTWAFLRREEPGALDGLSVVGRGPTVPTLPIITRASASDDEVSAWRRALAAATGDTALRADLDTLLIRGFVALDLADYDSALGPLVRRFSA